MVSKGLVAASVELLHWEESGKGQDGGEGEYVLSSVLCEAEKQLPELETTVDKRQSTCVSVLPLICMDLERGGGFWPGEAG